MKSVLVWILVAVNGLLLIGLAGRFTRGDVASAQMAPQRRISTYTMAPMELAAGQTGIVCIIDENSGQMAAVSYNGRNAIDVMPPIDLDRVAAPPLQGNFNNNGGGRY